MQRGPSPDYAIFLHQFKTVFDYPIQGQSSGQLLLKLRQEHESTIDYSMHFCILAADSSWNNPALIMLHRHGLSPELQRKQGKPMLKAML